MRSDILHILLINNFIGSVMVKDFTSITGIKFIDFKISTTFACVN